MRTFADSVLRCTVRHTSPPDRVKKGEGSPTCRRGRGTRRSPGSKQPPPSPVNRPSGSHCCLLGHTEDLLASPCCLLSVREGEVLRTAVGCCFTHTTRPRHLCSPSPRLPNVGRKDGRLFLSHVRPINFTGLSANTPRPTRQTAGTQRGSATVKTVREPYVPGKRADARVRVISVAVFGMHASPPPPTNLRPFSGQVSLQCQPQKALRTPEALPEPHDVTFLIQDEAGGHAIRVTDRHRVRPQVPFVRILKVQL